MRPADQAVRERALDVTRSFIVQAPAGSGKTELLIQRYLALLACVERPEAVLAITFTRKAAGEMRRRVLEAFEGAAGPRPEQPHEARTWELARAARERDGKLKWGLQQNPHRLEIRTIDSLCAALTRRMPWLSRLGAPPEIAEDAEELYRTAARATLALLESDSYFEPLARLLEHLDNDARALETLLARMLARRDQWLRHLGADRAELEAGLASVIREELERLRRAVPPELSPLAARGDLVELPPAEPESLESWRAIADALLTQKDTWRKRELKRLPQLEDCEELRRLLAQVRRLPPPRFTDEQWATVEAAMEALKLAAAQLKLEFGRRRQADYIEVMQAALDALGRADEPTELMLALDGRIEHILVDEFQDTSLSQFRLLEMLTAGWTPGDGRTLFLVGDPMQSIYRFREAEVGLFLKAAREGLPAARLERLCLSVNFRSDRSLVEWVNRAFPEVLAPSEEVATGAVPFSSSDPRPEAPPGLEVRIHPLIGKGQEEAEAARVLEIVREAQSRDPAARIAILVRARTHLPAILRRLRRAGLRYRAVEIDSLAEAPLVEDLLALTRALLDPSDRVAWLAILRAPWCGLTLEELHALAADAPEAAVWDLIREQSRLARLSSEGRARLGRLRRALEDCFAHRRPTLRAWVESGWLALGGPACAQAPGELENAGAFFALLEELDEGCDADLEALEERTHALWAAPDPQAPETLQVMTIHKAKGLEFDVVIVPGLGRLARADEPRLLAWLELPGGGPAARLLLAPVPEKGAEKDAERDALWGYLKYVESRKAHHEDGRLLYVAATRARRELHLIGHAARKQDTVQPAARSLLGRLWPAVRAEFERAAACKEDQAAEAAGAPAGPPPLVLHRLAADWVRPAPPPAPALPAEAMPGESEAAEPGVSYVWVGQTLRQVGTVVHRLLHRIAREGLANWDRERVAALRPLYRAALRDLAIPAEELDAAAEKVEHALAGILADPRGRWILAEHAEAESEYALSGVADGKLVSVRLDRTFVDAAGVRWIIDYKTGLHEGGSAEEFLDREAERYRAQLERYAALLGRTERRPIRMGLYFPLMAGWREWGAPRALPAL